MSSFRNAHQQYFIYLVHSQDNLGASPGKEFSVLKNLPAMQIQSLGQEDPLEEGTATHSSTFAWENPTDRGTWWATVHRIAKSQTRLQQLSTHVSVR